MRVLLIGIADSPYLRSLEAALSPFGFAIDTLDPSGRWLRMAGQSEKVYFTGVGRFMPGAIGRAVDLRCFLRDQVYDVCNIHYNSAFFGLIAEAIRASAARLVVSIWGSDMRHDSAAVRRLQKRVLDRADVVTINNPDCRKELAGRFNLAETKIETAFMPLGFLDLIEAKLASGFDASDAKIALGYSANRKLVLCGTNAAPAQQHLQILRSLEAAAESQPEIGEANLVFPLSYGAKSESERQLLISIIDASPLRTSCITDFISNDDLVSLRIATDCVVQVQKQDMFSAVIQEAIYSGSAVVTGAWLKYGFLHQMIPTLKLVDHTDDVGVSVAAALRGSKTSEQRQKIRDIAGLEESGKVWARILRGE